MADFVAVIRRAVDGLADNTPEMRVKVYERARGAVQRQLESMKPRPPEEMLRRQLDKLEAAIVEVEAEHAEALPVAEEPVAEAPVVQEEPQHAPPEQHHAAVEPHVEEAPPLYTEAHRQEEVTAYQPVHEEPAHEEPAHEEPAHEEPAHQEPAYEERAYEEPAHAQHQSADDHEPVEEWFEAPQVQAPAAVHYAEADAEPIQERLHQEASEHYAEDVPVAAGEPTHAAPQANAAHQAPADDVISQVEEIWGEVDAPAKRAASEPVAEPVMPAAAFAPAVFGHPVEPLSTAKAPVADKAFAWDADVFEELEPVAAPAAKPKQPVRQMPDNAFEDVDLFADVHSSPRAIPKNDAGGDGWRELKELAGFDKLAEKGRGGGSSIPSDLDRSMASKLQGKSFRMEPRRRRFNVTGIILTLLGLAVVAGGGYAAWANRQALNKMVADLISSAPKTAASTAPAPATETAKNNNAAAPTANAPAASTPATIAPAQNNNAAAQPPAAANTNVASLDNDANTVNTKFTQRLLANGAEEDRGPAAGGQPGVAEGKSVAEQNVAAAAAPAGAAAAPANNAPVAQSPAATAPVATPPSGDQQSSAAPVQQPPATQQPPPAGQQQTAAATDGQKVFLYEERLGQTSPTAFEGTVTWSLEEGKGEDGRPEPSVQGLISVPERGLTATITVSRNTDASLPASHLVELAFQVPRNFEGGAIDSVQRIALKATEQDRGDPLIAVPAKVTDDVYMVALNDFPDARKTNLDLLKSRNWMDIPVVYRNGRRALLTMEKGPTGTDDFNKAIAEWQALGGVASSGQ
ncbi:hypothetical protein PY650_06505 [Rhizobium calliandrae]|uniref:Uncharacterized protein n=1 Tax=Rhizobium calliandrae TaxID=1312182 RepID=A0ABT7K9Y2_9HYPH|nr:hypothetical protein [Rhizobium calliandrae]MDL2405311.1 hypothetical protein [Rhizobium calliandrae]